MHTIIIESSKYFLCLSITTHHLSGSLYTNSLKKGLNQSILGPLALVKENSKFQPAVHSLKIQLMSHPAVEEGLGKYKHHLSSKLCIS